MTDLDQMIRDGLEQSTSTVGTIGPAVLADRLVAARARRSRARRRVVMAVASVLVVVMTGAVAVAVRSGAPRTARVTTGPAPVADPGFVVPGGEGFHGLDTGPVPAMSHAALAWTGHELVVVGDGQAFAYRPETATWRSLPVPPLDQAGIVGMVWTGTEVVAVRDGPHSPHAAAWNPVTDEWRDLGAVPLAAKYDAQTIVGPRGVGGGAAVVWTGSRVLDLTHGAVLDPTTGSWSALALPDDLVPYTALLHVVPVWTGTEMVASSWSTQPGLAWDATGSSVREVPGVPAALVGLDPTYGANSLGVAVDGRVVLVSGTDDGRVLQFDPDTGVWASVPPLAGMDAGEGCPTLVGSVAGQVVVAPCEQQQLVALRDGTWREVGPPPAPTAAGSTTWVDAGGVLVGWTTTLAPESGPSQPAGSPPFLQAWFWQP